MTATRIEERAPERSLVDVRVVDSDIHPVPRPGEWIEHVPEPHRSDFWKRRKFGEVIDYDPQYDPVWEAATRHGLPVACHVSRGYYDLLPMPPAGPPSYNHDFMTTYSLLVLNQVASLVFDGVFERFPTLRIVLVEHAHSWLLPLLWRMDAVYDARKADLPHLKRKPSEYVYEHLRFTTQPLEHPEDRSELHRLLTWMEADRLLLFSTDYPHWTFDDPKWALRQIPAELQAPIMFQNAIDLYGLPAKVAALEGQNRVW